MYKRSKSASGATRSDSKIERKAQYPVLILAIGCVLVACVYFIGKIEFGGALDAIGENLEPKLTNVEVEADFRWVKKEDVRIALQGVMNNDYIKVNIDEVKQGLEKNPWVAYVTVQRQWPSTIKIQIEEQQPIARWAGTGFINKDGEIIKAKYEDELDRLPIFGGDEKLIEEIATWFALMKPVFSNYGLHITGLKVTELDAWIITVNSDLDIIVNADNKKRKIDNFLPFFDRNLRTKAHQIRKIDLRYKEALAVSWNG